MRIEIVGIGDELLAGFTVNSNAAFISRHLIEAGHDVARHTVLPDEPVALHTGLFRALGENDVVICTGGLGPTIDDNTRRTVADLVGCPIERNAEVHARLVERLGDDFPTLEDQSSIPAAATPLHNTVGTAPGLHFQLDHTQLFLLPGVPVEMEALFTEQVLPLLPVEEAQHREAVHIFNVREIDIDTALRALPPHDVALGIYPGLGVVTVRFTADTPEQVAPVRDGLLAVFPNQSFDSPSGTLEEAVHLLAIEKNMTIATAESCTAGNVAAHLTRFSGSSDFFLGGIVAYANKVKENVLGVSPQTLKAHGAVSEETAAEMASGACRLTGADLAVSISGVAGPTGGTPEKPVGTVCFAIARNGQTETAARHFRGNRAAIIQRSTNFALTQLLQALRLAPGMSEPTNLT
jgi:competence/damage-inducible protein CinA-like protein